MFGKLKEKLKGALSKFSKKAEEEAEEKEIVEESPENVDVKEEKVNSNEVKITYFVHGTTTDNEQKLASGHHDVALSELGVKQSKELIEQQLECKVKVISAEDSKEQKARVALPSKPGILIE